MPNQEEIVRRLHTIRTEHDAFLSEQRALSNVIQLPRDDVGSRSPSHRLRRVFVLTNAAPVWLNGLKRKLLADGWENVIFKGDLVLDKEQKGVDVAVDMSIAERAEVFVGNGVRRPRIHVVTLTHTPPVFEHVRQYSNAADSARPAPPDQPPPLILPLVTMGMDVAAIRFGTMPLCLAPLSHPQTISLVLACFSLSSYFQCLRVHARVFPDPNHEGHLVEVLEACKQTSMRTP